MKNLLLSAALLLSVSIGLRAEVPAAGHDGSDSQRLLKFIGIMKAHRADWFNHMKKHIIDKINLAMEHHNQYFAQKAGDIEALASGMDKDALLKKMLVEKVELSKKQAEEWKALCEKSMKEGAETYRAHKKEIDEFENPPKPEGEVKALAEGEEAKVVTVEKAEAAQPESKELGQEATAAE